MSCKVRKDFNVVESLQDHIANYNLLRTISILTKFSEIGIKTVRIGKKKTI